MTKNQNVFFVGKGIPILGKKIIEKCGEKESRIIYVDFSDGEYIPQLEKSVRGKNVFMIQSTNATETSTADNLFNILIFADAAKRASAKKVVAVIPYFGFARQERKDKPRTPITAKLVAKLLEASGIDRIITMDLHAEAIQGFFETPVDNLYASYMFVPALEKIITPNTIIASPDSGGLKRATKYATYFGTEVVICYKQRAKGPNEVEKVIVIGDPSGKDVIVFEDIIDTGNTLAKVGDALMKKGAKSVTVFSSHGVLSGKAYENLKNSCIQKIYITDSHPKALVYKEEHPDIDVEIISSADLFAKAIQEVIIDGSVNELFIFQ